MPGEIERIRQKIDLTDNQILELLEKRADLAKEIGEEKKRLAQQGGEIAYRAPKFYDPKRENSIIERLQKQSRTSFPKAAIPFVYKEIISACRSLEASFRVAFLGPAGTYTQLAATRAFGHSVDFVESATIDGVFDTVLKGDAEFGIVPLENSYEGGVATTLDSLLKTDILIQGEVVVKVNHCLLSKTSSTGKIKRIYSHPQALGQCRKWISENLSGAELISSKSTGAAALQAAEDPSSAAIASRLSAEMAGLLVVREGIQDQPDNSTRFAIIAMADGPVTGADKTSLVMIPHEGPQSQSSLTRVLKMFDSAGISVVRVESRAGSQKIWQYLYFIDFLGHRSEAHVKLLLKKLEPLCERLKLLGSYPMAGEFFNPILSNRAGREALNSGKKRDGQAGRPTSRPSPKKRSRR